MNRLGITYFLVWGTLVFLLLVPVCVLNICVDPYNVFSGEKRFKGDLYHHAPEFTRRSKAERLRRGGWDVLLFGTSRTEVGFNTLSDSWDDQTVFNAGLNGTNLYEIRYIFDHALAHNRPQLVVLNLSLITFSTNRTTEGDFGESRLNPNLDYVTYYLKNLFSYQNAEVSLDRFLDDIGPRQYAQMPDTRGTKPLLDPGETRDRFDRNFRRPHFVHPALYNGFNFGVDRLDVVRHIAETCRRENIRLEILFPPVHALQLEVIQLMGVWPEFERMKTEVVHVADRANLTPSEAPAIAVWDFTGYSGLQAEPVPPENEPETRMQWYFESSHFKPELGDRVIARILGKDPTSSFGIQLTEHNLASHLAHIQSQRYEYISQFPADISWVERVYEESTPERLRQLKEWAQQQTREGKPGRHI
ncbi:MAG: hypothetical protein O2954_04085 [bacterium]|nr:hypothetical protein [bacterium]